MMHEHVFCSIPLYQLCRIVKESPIADGTCDAFMLEDNIRI